MRIETREFEEGDRAVGAGTCGRAVAWLSVEGTVDSMTATSALVELPRRAGWPVRLKPGELADFVAAHAPFEPELVLVAVWPRLMGALAYGPIEDGAVVGDHQPGWHEPARL